MSNIIELSGRIDNNSSAAIEARINAVLDAQPQTLILDMRGVDFVSSLGLRVMLSAAKRCRKQSTKIALCGVLPQVEEVFQLSGLSAFFPMHPNCEAAQQALA
jgi:anti-anti-sigma factor